MRLIQLAALIVATSAGSAFAASYYDSRSSNCYYDSSLQRTVCPGDYNYRGYNSGSRGYGYGSSRYNTYSPGYSRNYYSSRGSNRYYSNRGYYGRNYSNRSYYNNGYRGYNNGYRPRSGFSIGIGIGN